MTSGPFPVDEICPATGYGLVAANGGTAWRVAKDEYVQRSGLNGVLSNDRVGPLAPGIPDPRGRYDTIGRTVYFAASPKVCLAEVLQAFRSEVMAMTKDATALGMDLATYRDELTQDFHARGLPAPGEVSVEWQMTYGLHKVDMPENGWWVHMECAPTLNALSEAVNGEGGLLTLADMTGSNRGRTTQLAQIVRDSTLSDGSLPLGVVFSSKTGYGACWAWWNRRADDNLNPGANDPRLAESLNVNVPDLTELVREWRLNLVGGPS